MSAAPRNVLSYTQMASHLQKRLKVSTRECIQGGRCDALDAMQAGIKQLFDDLDHRYERVVLEKDLPEHGSDGVLRTYSDMNTRVRSLVQENYHQCPFASACGALSRIAGEVDSYFGALAESNDYVVLARDATARVIKRNRSANRALIAAHVEARQNWSGRLKGSSSELIRQDRDS